MFEGTQIFVRTAEGDFFDSKYVVAIYLDDETDEYIISLVNGSVISTNETPEEVFERMKESIEDVY